MKLLGKSGDKSKDTKATDTEGSAAGSSSAASGEKLDLDAAATSRTGDDKAIEELNAGLAPPDPDAGPKGPTKLRRKALFAALKRTFKQYSSDNVSDWAAALTYYGILSIFPAALALVSILGLLASDGQATVEDTDSPGVGMYSASALARSIESSLRAPNSNKLI